MVPLWLVGLWANDTAVAARSATADEMNRTMLFPLRLNDVYV
jgi:hypothetical protein